MLLRARSKVAPDPQAPNEADRYHTSVLVSQTVKVESEGSESNSDDASDSDPVISQFHRHKLKLGTELPVESSEGMASSLQNALDEEGASTTGSPTSSRSCASPANFMSSCPSVEELLTPDFGNHISAESRQFLLPLAMRWAEHGILNGIPLRDFSRISLTDQLKINACNVKESQLTFAFLRAGFDFRLGERGRSDLKQEISRITRGDASIKDICFRIARLKHANIYQLLQLAEICNVLDKAIQISQSYWLDSVKKRKKTAEPTSSLPPAIKVGANVSRRCARKASEIAKEQKRTGECSEDEEATSSSESRTKTESPGEKKTRRNQGLPTSSMTLRKRRRQTGDTVESPLDTQDAVSQPVSSPVRPRRQKCVKTCPATNMSNETTVDETSVASEACPCEAPDAFCAGKKRSVCACTESPETESKKRKCEKKSSENAIEKEDDSDDAAEDENAPEDDKTESESADSSNVNETAEEVAAASSSESAIPEAEVVPEKDSEETDAAEKEDCEETEDPEPESEDA